MKGELFLNGKSIGEVNPIKTASAHFESKHCWFCFKTESTADLKSYILKVGDIEQANTLVCGECITKFKEK